MDFTQPSPQDKLAKYQEFNSPVNDNTFVNYVSNKSTDPQVNTDIPQSISYPKEALTKRKNPIIYQPSMNDWDPSNTTFSIDKNTGLQMEDFDRNKAKLKGMNTQAKDAYNYYVNDHKLPPAQAAAIVGNLYHESALRTDSVEKGNTGNGRGIAQWDVRDRWPAYLKWAEKQGKDPMALKSQLDYVLVEPGEGDRALKKLQGITDVNEATMVFGRAFERPNEKLAAWDKRQGYAKTLLGV